MWAPTQIYYVKSLFYFTKQLQLFLFKIITYVASLRFPFSFCRWNFFDAASIFINSIFTASILFRNRLKGCKHCCSKTFIVGNRIVLCWWDWILEAFDASLPENWWKFENISNRSVIESLVTLWEVIKLLTHISICWAKSCSWFNL